MSWGATWNGLIALSVPRLGDEEYEKDIHVIEYAALIEANRKLEIAREALEYYSNYPSYHFRRVMTARALNEDYEDGSKARKALEEIK